MNDEKDKKHEWQFYSAPDKLNDYDESLRPGIRTPRKREAEETQRRRAQTPRKADARSAKASLAQSGETDEVRRFEAAQRAWHAPRLRVRDVLALLRRGFRIRGVKASVMLYRNRLDKNVRLLREVCEQYEETGQINLDLGSRIEAAIAQAEGK